MSISRAAGAVAAATMTALLLAVRAATTAHSGIRPWAQAALVLRLGLTVLSRVTGQAERRDARPATWA